jgi:prolyl oligopeptidase
MKKLFWLCFLFSAFSVNAQIKYPKVLKGDIVDIYHGVKVEDPYQWLEDESKESTKKWIKDENKVTFDYLASIPFRNKVRKKLEELWNYPRYSSPSKKGEYYYFYKNDGLQNQSILYRQIGLDGKPEEFLDPNKLSTDGTAALGSTQFSKTGKYLAYTVAQAGSDWQDIYVMETTTRKVIADKIEWSKFGGADWNGDEGFYYSGFDKPDEASKLSKKNEFNKIFYHKIGTPQSEDKLIYEDKKNPLRFHGIGLTEDGRFLILSISEGSNGSEIWYRDLKDSRQKNFQLLIPGFKTRPGVIDNKGDSLIVQTNEDAPNYKVVIMDPKNPAKTNWKTVIPEKEEALQSVGTAGGYLFANYLKDASTRVYQYSYNGILTHEIKLPGIGTASGFGGDKPDKEFFYTYSSFNKPPSVYRYDIETGESTLFYKTILSLDTDDFVTEQAFFNSVDGTRVPMFITYKKGMKLDGQNPLLMYGYGGFNIPMTPAFSISNAFFIANGGIYVVVNLRGGSEYGEKWHKAGMLEKKQNVFNDFIRAAEILIKRGYTSSQKIAIKGGSNGGLLVGAVMTQRPELFKVALPAVGVMDMLRFQKFTVGYLWTAEYGNADSAGQFPYIYRYSPYHNLKSGVNYPATLITTADHDDRVVPGHSFKFASRLQEYNSGSNPVLIRIETNAGHGAGKPTSKQIEEAADVWSFVMQNLGMSFESDEKMLSKDAEKNADATDDKNEGKGTDGKEGGESKASGNSGSKAPVKNTDSPASGNNNKKTDKTKTPHKVKGN